MKKFVIYSVQFIVILALFFHVPTVSAQESSPSADLKQKIQDLLNEASKQAKLIQQDVNHKLQNRLVAGLVQSSSDTQIILTTDTKNQLVITSNFTDYNYGGLQTSINKDNFVVALGDLDDKGNLVAKKIVKRTPPNLPPAQYLWGKVLSASSSGMMVALKDNSQKALSINSDTNFKSSPKENQIIITVAVPGKTGTLLARTIYLIREAPSPTPKVSTQSATQSDNIKK